MTVIPRFPIATLSLALVLQFAATGPATALTITSLESGVSPDVLAQTLMGTGVFIDHVEYVGANSASGLFSDASATGLGINAGVILTSGAAVNAYGPNNSEEMGVNNEMPGSSLLGTLTTDNTFDSTILRFNFIPTGNVLNFNYVFASEEYNEWVGTPYNDVFGFFVNGVNQALIPGSITPVAINNVNNLLNSAYYRDNSTGGSYIDLQYDGLTTVLNFSASVTPGVWNTIELGVTDVGDGIFDSAAFIEEGTFSSTLLPGSTEGETPQNAFMPDIETPVNEEIVEFDFVDIVFDNDPYFIDPMVAVGYEYRILGGPNFESIILPPLSFGDNLYDLWLWDFGLNDYADSGVDIAAGVQYFFGGGGVDRLQIRGIEVENMLDPSSPVAFVTGFTHVSTGVVDVAMTPLEQYVDSVPLPATLWLFGIGLAGLGLARKRVG